MECVVCTKIKEKKALIVYEDEVVCAVLPSKPAVLGHIKVYPKKHIATLEETDDNLLERLFFVSNLASSAVFETMKAHGTNIMLSESQDHLAIDVVPRKENDGINVLWKPTQPSPQELNDIFSKIKDKAFGLGRKEEKKVIVVEDKLPIEKIPTAPAAVEKKEPEKKEQPKAPEPKKPEGEKVSYLVKNIIKLP
jgi:histidine triad (HIT) family protein